MLKAWTARSKEFLRLGKPPTLTVRALSFTWDAWAWRLAVTAIRLLPRRMGMLDRTLAGAALFQSLRSARTSSAAPIASSSCASVWAVEAKVASN